MTIFIKNLCSQSMHITRLILICFVIIYSAGVSAQPNLSLAVTLPNGQSKSLDSMLSDKPVYLKFWASWCKPCMQEMPHLQRMQQTLGNEIDIIAVNIDINETNQDIENVKQKYKLTMPIVKDSQGLLAKELKFVGTPFHVVLNRINDVVHTGHQATKKLDSKLQLLAQDPSQKLPQAELVDLTGEAKLFTTNTDKQTILFFTASWCDWYLEDTRPEMSQACIKGQQQINRLHQQHNNLQWQLITSHLWTTTKDLQQYVDKYSITMPNAIDTSGDLFFAYGVKNLPTIVVLQGEEVVLKTHQVNELADYLTR